MSHEIDTHPDSAEPTRPTPAIEHITVENDDEPNECALFPQDASENELLTTWITAQEGSYVDLESTR